MPAADFYAFQQPQANPDTLLSSVALGTPNVDVSVTVSGADGDKPRLWTRVSTGNVGGNAGYFVQLTLSPASRQMQVARRDYTGTVTSLYTEALSAGLTSVLRLRFAGNAFEAYVDGVQHYGGSDVTVTGTRAGIGCGAAGTARFDTFVATPV